MADQAWIVREGERQRLIEELLADVANLEDRLQRPVHYGIVESCILYLKNQTSAFPSFINSTFFRQLILVKIDKFARAPEEKNFLVAKLLSKLVEAISIRFNSDLGTVEISDPQKIFGVESSTTKI